MTLDKRKIQAYSKAYDAMYDLNVTEIRAYDDVLEVMETKVNKYGYTFKLNHRTQKFRMVLK